MDDGLMKKHLCHSTTMTPRPTDEMGVALERYPNEPVPVEDDWTCKVYLH